jgi:ribA/ribD-fused uncharacterized protein
MNMAIRFWRPENQHGIFSNFSYDPIVIDGVEYSTPEHFFQSQKAQDSREWKEIVDAPTPTLAKRLGGACHLRPDWENYKAAVMYQTVRERVRQNPKFRQALIDTGGEVIEEVSPFDYYWGIGRDGTGRNMLGEVLMDIRQEIKEGEL